MASATETNTFSKFQIIFPLGLGKPSNVKKLNETAAIELGAELLGESIIFFIAVLTLSAEYYRQSKKSSAEAAVLEERWTNTENRLEELEFLTEKQRTEIRELTRLIYAKQSGISKIQPLPASQKPSGNESQTVIVPAKAPLRDAIDESLQKLNVPK